MKSQNENVLSFSELKSLCQTPSNIHLPYRHDKLLECVLLMGFLGLRVSEAINFTWQTVPVENKPAFLVQGKGNKQRLVFNLLNNPYIAKKAKSDPNKDKWKSISRMAIWKYLKNKSQELSLPWTITPHTLRRSFASILHYDFHLEPPAIQQLLGHSQFRTTEKYLKKDTRFLLNSLQRHGFML
ncbi:MAG: tyrosine recombinase XerD [Mycoplasmataceae bacterium RV_VA103A]|nr:MAG: tyrosine recombinase XerD [Mycoplasmataceae bacterium RV_VA103A]